MSVIIVVMLVINH